VEQRLATIARDQDGLVTTSDIRSLGLTAWEQRTLMATGWLDRVAPNVFAVAGAPRSHRYELRRGLLALGDGSAISYEAAAHLHRLDRSRPGVAEFTVPRAARAPSCGLSVHTSQWLPPGDVVEIDHLRVTSATRTIIDLAHARRPVERIEAAIDSAIRLGLSSPHALACRLETLRGSGRWGCRLLDDLVIHSGGHSILERRFLELVRRAGLPRPITQAIHRKDARHVARVDFSFAAHRVVVEVSGQHGHSSPTDRGRDAQRRNELQDLAVEVYEYTDADVTQRPLMVIRTLRARLGRRPVRHSVQ
jgi:hypothetical protein